MKCNKVPFSLWCDNYFLVPLSGTVLTCVFFQLLFYQAANGLEQQETLKILENIALVYLIEEKYDEAHVYYKKAGKQRIGSY